MRAPSLSGTKGVVRPDSSAKQGGLEWVHGERATRRLIRVQASEDELLEGFHTPSADGKESIIKAEGGWKFMRRRSAEGESSG